MDRQEHWLPLVRQAIQGDESAFATLCETKAQDILYMCIKLMGNLQDGEDAAQEVLCVLQSSILRLREAETFPVWLNRIIYNTCYKTLRSNKKRKTDQPIFEHEAYLVDEDLAGLPQELAERNAAQQALASGIDTLPYKYKTALLMYYYEELPVRSIAQVLKVSEKAVYKLLKRAKDSLKNQLEQEAALHGASGFAIAGLAQALRAEAAQVAVTEAVGRFMLSPVLTAAGASGAAAAAAGAAGASGAAAAGSVAGAGAGAALGAATSAGVLAASAMLAATVVAAGVTFGSASPVPASPAPQPHAAQSIQPAEQQDTTGEDYIHADGSLYAISEMSDTSSTSSPSGVGPSSGPSSELRQVAPAPPESYTGSVGLLALDGTPVAGGGAYAAGGSVRLETQAGLVAEATVDATGAYTLTVPQEMRGQAAVLVITPPAGFAAPGAASLLVGDVLPILYISIATSPTASIEFYAADGTALGGDHADPARAVLYVADATPVTASWRLLADGAELSQGSGHVVEFDLDALRPDTGVSWYEICFTACDIAGNSTEVCQNFVVFSV